MDKKSGAALLFAITSALVLSLLAPATAANLDDGYPQDTAAPGRTCPKPSGSRGAADTRS